MGLSMLPTAVRALVATVVLSLGFAATAGAQAPASGGGKLVVGIPLITESLDARTFSALAYVTLNLFHDRLLSVDDQGKYRPALAESWRLVDAHTWQFKLEMAALFREEAPLIFGLEVAAIHALSPRVAGAVFTADGTVDLTKASVK